MPNKKLVIIWTGDFSTNLQKISNNNITFVWAKYWKELCTLLAAAKGFIFPWEEDFWITPVEALACGVPIFAYKAWWLLETNKQWITWEFFTHPKWKDFIEKFQFFDTNISKWKYTQKNLLAQASIFGEEAFEKRINKEVEQYKNKNNDKAYSWE
jgi:glycosyltransferase involved in cell wall biosynthesis